MWGVTAEIQFTLLQISISIHTPRVGRDYYAETLYLTKAGFQSTRPVWGVTDRALLLLEADANFNPHAPCGA